MYQQPIRVELLSQGPDAWTIIAGAVAVAGLVVSLITLFRQRTCVTAVLNTAYSVDGRSLKIIACDFLFSNGSSLPIAITDLSISAIGEEESSPNPEKVILKTISTRSAGQTTSRHIYSDALPINLLPHSAARAVIVFKKGFVPFGSDYVARNSDYWKLKVVTTKRSFTIKLLPPTCETLWNGDNALPDPGFL